MYLLLFRTLLIHKEANRLIVKDSQIDAVIQDYHIKGGHMKRDKLHYEISTKFCAISKDRIQEWLVSNCAACVQVSCWLHDI